MRNIITSVTGIWHCGLTNSERRFWIGVVREHFAGEIHGRWHLISIHRDRGANDSLYIRHSSMQTSSHAPRGAP